MARRNIIVVLVVVLAGTLLIMGQSGTPVSKSGVTGAGYVPAKEYDPKRDAARDIANAVKEAQRSNRNVLVEIGGQWCIWCRYFDKFFAENSTLAQYRDENYVMVKVNFSPENKNEAVISGYGEVPGYPHLFVLDKDGKLLHSQDTSKLEEGRGYNTTAVATFLKQWSPSSTNVAK